MKGDVFRDTISTPRFL